MNGTHQPLTKLRKRREDLRRTAEEIASLAGIDRGELSRIERQIRPLTPENARKLAAIYQVDVAVLLREAKQVVKVRSLPAPQEATHA